MAAAAKPGDVVWYPGDGSDEWAPCVLNATNPDGSATVKVKGKDVSVRAEDRHKILPRDPPEKLTGKLTMLDCDGLGPEGVEDSIRQHFCKTAPYTNIDDVIVSVNPIREVPIHDKEWVQKYAELNPSLPPHIFNAAAVAYKNLQEKKQSQTIFLLGEPSAGKSQAFSNILTFLLEIAGEPDLDPKIKALQAVLKPFLSLRLNVGSGQDQFAWMSTRAMLQLELIFDEDGFVSRAAGEVRALESSRVAYPGDGTNYDALYKAVRDPSGKEWLGDLDEFRLLGEEFDVSEYDKDGSELKAWKEALDTFELDASLMVQFLCGLVLLGEVKFKSGKAGIDCEGPVDQAAKALGVQATDFSAALTAGGSVEDAEQARDATIEDVYVCLLSKVIQQANSKMVGDSKATGQSISIVEMPAISGDWPRALQPGSGFEMMMSQWLTETMNSQLVPAAMHGYVQQLADKGVKLDISQLSSQVSSSRALRAIEGPKGIMQKLRGPKLSAKASNEAVREEFIDWATDVEKEAAAKKETPIAKVLGKTPAVSCEISGATTLTKHVLDLKFVQSCMGATVPEKVKTVLVKSSQKLVSDVLKTTSSCIGSSKGLVAAEESVKFVNDVLQGANKNRPWLVCCMRPNDKGKLNNISKQVLLKQARAFCLADLVHFAAGAQKASFSMAWPLPEFRKQYAALLPTIDGRTTEVEAFRKLIASCADGQSMIGAEAVYGSLDLVKKLDLQLQEKDPKKNSKEAPPKEEVDAAAKKAAEEKVASETKGKAENEAAAKKVAEEKVDSKSKERAEDEAVAKKAAEEKVASETKGKAENEAAAKKVAEEKVDTKSKERAEDEAVAKTAAEEKTAASAKEKAEAEAETKKATDDKPVEAEAAAKKATEEKAAAEAKQKAEVEAAAKKVAEEKGAASENDKVEAEVAAKQPSEEKKGVGEADEEKEEEKPAVQEAVKEDIEAAGATESCRCSCGTTFDEGASFCKNCGSKRPEASMAVECSCGTVFQDDAKFCRDCGARRPAQAAEPVSCSSCGKTLSPEAAFCSNCGEKQSTEAFVEKASRRMTLQRGLLPPGDLLERAEDKTTPLQALTSAKIGAPQAKLLGGAPKKKVDPRMDNIDRIVARSPGEPSDSGEEYDDQSMPRPQSDVDAFSPMDNERGPFRTMALNPHATLHSALSQMAAVLRVAKESETKLRSSQNAHTAELEELRAECDAWRVESDRLWVQVKELQQQAFWKAPQSA